MIYNKKSIDDVDVKDKRVLVRVDFNIPIKNGEITDDSRIVAAMPTIKNLLDRKAKVILCSHLGKPKGVYKEEFSLAPVARYLERVMGLKVLFIRDPEVVGEATVRLIDTLVDGELMMLENTRFRLEEEQNDEGFSKKLASICDIYVCDAFGTAHRAHASTAGVTNFVNEAVCGYLIEKELKYLGEALSNPDRPFCAILGGAKVSDKIDAITALIDKVNTLIIGGAMSYTFLAAKGIGVGSSLVEREKIDFARDMIQKAAEKGVNLLLPIDHVMARQLSETAEAFTSDGIEIPDGFMGLDIGPRTAELFEAELHKCRTVVWNGPMGVFEMSKFAAGTEHVAKVLGDLENAVTVVGGGDSAAAVAKFGLKDKLTLVSTGGGASLEYIEGKPLPGIAGLDDKE